MKDKKFYIYLISNNHNDKKYIGSRISFSGRPEKDNYMGSGKLINEEYASLGIHGFTKKILEEGKFQNKEYVLERESYYIKKYGSMFPDGYNLVDPASYPDFNRLGMEVSEETRKKQSISAKNRKNHPWQGKKRPDLSKSMMGSNNPMFGKPSPKKGNPLSEETKQKIREARKKQISPMKGKKMSEESKEKIRQTLRKTRELKKIIENGNQY